jgi:hypothetical protein
MEIIKFKNLKISEFISFLNKADINDKQIVEFSPDFIKSKAHPPLDKTYINYQETETNSILEFINLEKRLKFPFNTFKKTISILKLYLKSGIKEINGEFHCNKSNDDLFLEGIALKFIGKTKTQINSAEIQTIPYISDEIWSNISNHSEPILKFNLEWKQVIELIELNDIYKKNNQQTHAFKVEFDTDKNKINLESKENEYWKITDIDNLTLSKENFSMMASYNIIFLLSENNYTFYVSKLKNGSYVLVAKSSDKSMYLNSLQPK